MGEREGRRERERIGIGTYSHRQQPRPIMHKREIFIRKRLSSIHARAARSIAVQEVSPLNHEILDDTVEFGALVALGAAEVVFRLAGAELAEILGGARDGVGVEEHFDAAEGFTVQGEVEEDGWVGCCCCCHGVNKGWRVRGVWVTRRGDVVSLGVVVALRYC